MSKDENNDLQNGYKKIFDKIILCIDREILNFYKSFYDAPRTEMDSPHNFYFGVEGGGE